MTFNYFNLLAGTYTIDYIDANGCPGSATIVVTEPPPLGANCSNVSDVSCNGGSDGAADVQGVGGTAPYSGTGAQAGLTAGSYTFTVTDANGCTATCTTTINEPAPLVATCTSTDVSCNGGTDGSTTVIASGGSGGYSGDGTTTGLAAGSYTYTVTDDNGCSATCTVTIHEPSALDCYLYRDCKCHLQRW